MARPTPTRPHRRGHPKLPTQRTLVVRAGALVTVAAVWLALIALPVGAHSTLLAACPGPGDVVNSIDELRLEFARPIIDDGVANIDVLADEGQTELNVGPATISDDALTLTAVGPGEVAAGSYILRYQATSDDGDLTDGGHQFTVDPDGSVQSETCDTGAAGSGTTAAGWVLLALGVVAMAVVVLFLRPRAGGDEADGGVET